MLGRLGGHSEWGEGGISQKGHNPCHLSSTINLQGIRTKTVGVNGGGVRIGSESGGEVWNREGWGTLEMRVGLAGRGVIDAIPPHHLLGLLVGGAEDEPRGKWIRLSYNHSFSKGIKRSGKRSFIQPCFSMLRKAGGNLPNKIDNREPADISNHLGAPLSDNPLNVLSGEC